MKRGLGEAGFSLMEILVLLILLALLVSIALARFGNLTLSAQVTATRERLQNIREAIIGNPDLVAGGQYAAPGYWGDMGRLPSALSELSTQGGQPAWNKYTSKGWNGPYIESSQFNDAWGNAICFRTAACSSPCPAVTTSSRSFTLQSAGPDGTLYNADDVTSSVSF